MIVGGLLVVEMLSVGRRGENASLYFSGDE